ncbi:STAS-like domain-containing protein [Emcibacter nanhaiensis]|uniref:DUF4325 domain-containing protein n=1 Tax=Emcibacter nanhaiensis TaxID=1505037 RepID=A0A501PW82_9PROT|nr:STAS-like domain-containing protein [Emcibacter nanhaiensis]TPD64006.1 DUF4325 domain-containing protein [Emcibacter nanhaiensis]
MTNNTKLISIKNDFSIAPGGRLRSDGPDSGEEFREDLLEPLVQEYEKLKIDLDGVEGYGSSFLEEAFGGLVRANILPYETIKNRIELVTQDDFLKVEIQSYMEDANKAANS